MSKEFRSTRYPSIVGSAYGWWHKPLDSTISIIIVTILIITVFLLGIWFTTQYFKIWSIVEAKGINNQTNLLP